MPHLFNPACPCCGEPAPNCVCSFDVTITIKHSTSVNDFDLYVHDLVHDEVCWSGNPDTTLLVWSSTTSTKVVKSKRKLSFADANGFLVWYNQKTNTYLPVHPQNIQQTVELCLDQTPSTKPDCPLYVCGIHRFVRTVSGGNTIHCFRRVSGPGVGEYSIFYYAGYNTGDVSEISLPEYYHHMTAKCNEAWPCALDRELPLYLHLLADHNLSCLDGMSVLLMTPDPDNGRLWSAEYNDMKFVWDNCSAQFVNSKFTLYQGETQLFTSGGTYECNIDSNCYHYGPPIRHRPYTFFASSPIVSCPPIDPDKAAIAAFYLSHDPTRIVECVCKTPLPKTLYISFVSIPEGCPLTTDMVVPLHLTKAGSVFTDNVASHTWSNEAEPLVVSGYTFKIFFSSYYYWAIAHSSLFMTNLAQHREQFGLLVTMDGPDPAFEGGVINCSNINAQYTCPGTAIVCDPLHVEFDVALVRLFNLCTVCPEFRAIVTE